MLSKSKIKYIQTLGQKKFRQEEGLFIAEGPKLADELLAADLADISEIFALPEWIEERKIPPGITCTAITPEELEKISQLTTPNQVLILVKQFNNLSAPVAKGTVTLALENIQDPGNLGTIIRIADWFGLTQIVCSPGTADLYNPKVVQATMGSILRVRVYYQDLVSWISEQKGMPICAATLGGTDIRSVKPLKEGIIIIGNESKGISPELQGLASSCITISRKGQAESLNAAVATGIILSHLT